MLTGWQVRVRRPEQSDRLSAEYLVVAESDAEAMDIIRPITHPRSRLEATPALAGVLAALQLSSKKGRRPEQ